MSFFELGTRERLGDKSQILQLDELLDWSKIRPLLKGFHKNETHNEGGPIGYDLLSMYKAILLGQWHSLSDPGLEDSLRVRLDFMLFTGFGLGDDLPDSTTLCRFRNKLVSLGLDEVLFNEINSQLESLGLKVENAHGAVIDATIIESAARPRRVLESIEESDSDDTHYVKRDSADPDASWKVKRKKAYFGYQGFAVTDDLDGYINDIHVTPANHSEMGELYEVLSDIKGKRVYADKGFASRENRQHLKNHDLKDGIMHKAVRGKKLTQWQSLKNKLISKRRFIVEQGFGTLKRRFKFTRACYFTTRKVEAQMIFKATCFNLLKALNKHHQISAMA